MSSWFRGDPQGLFQVTSPYYPRFPYILIAAILAPYYAIPLELLDAIQNSGG